MQELAKRFLKIFLFVSFTSEFLKAQLIETVPLWKLISSTIQTDTRNSKLNIDTLGELLRGIDYLNLHLFKESNLENDIIQQLLQQSFCPLQLSVGRIMPQPTPNQRHWALVTSSADLAMNLNGLARRLWIERGALRIFYIIPNGSSGGFDCFFLNPFVKTGGQRGEMSRLDGQNYQRIFQNLHGYPLRTYIFHSVYSNIEVFTNETTRKIIGATGADGKVADLLANKMNFTMDLQWPDDAFFGARSSNGSYNGAIGRIVRFETDLIITGFFIKDYLTRDIAFSSPVYMDELCCYVKKASRIPQSILPLFAVNVDIWITFIFVGFVCPFIWMLLRYLNLSTLANRAAFSQPEKLKIQELRYITQSHVQQYKRIVIDAWVMWVRVNLVYYPPFTSERVFIASLSLVSVIFGALFESSLATGYIRPLHYKDINSMKELDEANIRIYIKHAAMRDDLFTATVQKYIRI
ncbi:unnamed protein product [Ceratitis capitata]|uniref:(Mediterranean fruit fly) hypothetical protein n=1 Tax=Ceratitis capitata TaxID=7213 RepID=A0A811TZT9_CERCA|nr:unnamed protein product [Ceratitis capitata]